MRATEMLGIVILHVSITALSDRVICVCVNVFTNDPLSFCSYVNSTSMPLSSVESAFKKNIVMISSRFPIHHQTFKIHNSSFLRYAQPTMYSRKDVSTSINSIVPCLVYAVEGLATWSWQIPSFFGRLDCRFSTR